jgi:hypothetical protein
MMRVLREPQILTYPDGRLAWISFYGWIRFLRQKSSYIGSWSITTMYLKLSERYGMCKVNYLTTNVVALAGLLTGASIVHEIYKPDLVGVLSLSRTN